MSVFLQVIYIVILSGLGLYGLIGFVTLWCFWRYCQRPAASPVKNIRQVDWPLVTVQLPIFNERFVVDRLLAAAAELDYPADRLEIQIVDDSTDETVGRVAELVTQYRTNGINMHHLRREKREGFKAGALAVATAQARGEFIAIFDADFQPQPHFLRQTIPHFHKDAALGMVQTRWGHLNSDYSSLTAAQAMVMDKHFAVEQPVSFNARFYPRFNGTAGIWRRACIEDAGGWRNDTACEDMCLSTRAILKGWQFEFLPDVVTPGELPPSISAYKNQQARWAKGSFQCLLRYGLEIFRDTQYPWYARAYALISMSGYLAHPLMLAAVLLQIPLLLTGYDLSSWLIVFSILGLGQPLLFLLGQQLIYPDWLQRLRHFPMMMMLTLGLSPTITRSVIEVLLGQPHIFIRTPKGHQNVRSPMKRHINGYRLPFDKLNYLEWLLASYCGIGLILAHAVGTFGPVILLLCGLGGFLLVATLGIRE